MSSRMQGKARMVYAAWKLALTRLILLHGRKAVHTLGRALQLHTGLRTIRDGAHAQKKLHMHKKEGCISTEEG